MREYSREKQSRGQLILFRIYPTSYNKFCGWDYECFSNSSAVNAGRCSIGLIIRLCLCVKSLHYISFKLVWSVSLGFFDSSFISTDKIVQLNTQGFVSQRNTKHKTLPSDSHRLGFSKEAFLKLVHSKMKHPKVHGTVAYMKTTQLRKATVTEWIAQIIPLIPDCSFSINKQSGALQ